MAEKILKEYQCDNDAEYKKVQVGLFEDGLRWSNGTKQTIKNPYNKYPTYLHVWSDGTITHSEESADYYSLNL